MKGLSVARPWIDWDLGAAHRILSWSLTRPGFVEADRIVWREVRNADLPQGLDVLEWFGDVLSEHGAQDAVAFLTSRDVGAVEFGSYDVGGVIADAVATVGLSNAERIGARVDRSNKNWGTINVAVRVNVGLSDAALVEALSIATQARTVAVMEVGHILPTGVATGTGTDCIAVAAPAGDEAYAGMHTALGEAIGAAVHMAVSKGARDWMAHVRREGEV